MGEGVVRIDLWVGRWDRSYLVAWPCGEGYRWQHKEGDDSEKDPLSLGGESEWEGVRGG